MKTDFVTFGEIMMRLSPPNHLRFSQAHCFDVEYGGSEANVSVALSNFGMKAGFVTRLPYNDLGDACLQHLHKYRIDTDHVLRGGDRLGIYFLEHGASLRGSKVVYDRSFSAFSTIQPGMFDWQSIFTSSYWFHWTGITPAVSKGCADTCFEAVKAAADLGISISCDLNYRSKLWKWGEAPADVMGKMVDYCDLLICNEEDAQKVFGIHAPDIDVISGVVDADKYLKVCDLLKERFPKLKVIAITLRGSISATKNTWAAVLWKDGNFYQSSCYQIDNILDRVGAGDSFDAGLLYGLNKFGTDDCRTLEFATAASALKHTIFGDFNHTTIAEVETILSGNLSGRVIR